ncbi:TPA: hypothetical protein MDT80_005347 [Klebsiella pneumoniae]|nr:hypothetical protein [Klebsiella pneumoniae]HBQ0197192.1 hypothetical protein [Klebsiella pneumoniae]HBQ1250675.1 hypothetical protein [Klebsiella pneumoniae]HBV2757296.1 hypothetical protein [Klebsiella pneumoniae]HBV7299436.1 hypothetical protein [Klebsiella pneumoniae]
MKRGIVSLPLEFITWGDGRTISTGSSLSILDMNFFALYSDELIIPESNLISYELAGQKDFIESGFLKRPLIPIIDGEYSGADVALTYSKAQTQFLDYKRRTEPSEDWRLNIIGNSFQLCESGSEIKNLVRLELTNALPVPDSTVNIHDILAFKSKRRDEFEAFNSYLDELYIEVASSGDFHLSRAKAFSKLYEALNDLEKLNSEGWRSPIKFDTSALFEANNGDLMSGASALYSIWEANQGNLAGAITAGVTAVIGQGFARLKPSLQSVRRKPNDNIAYLSYAHKESILKKT